MINGLFMVILQLNHKVLYAWGVHSGLSASMKYCVDFKVHVVVPCCSFSLCFVIQHKKE